MARAFVVRLGWTPQPDQSRLEPSPRWGEQRGGHGAILGRPGRFCAVPDWGYSQSCLSSPQSMASGRQLCVPIVRGVETRPDSSSLKFAYETPGRLSLPAKPRQARTQQIRSITDATASLERLPPPAAVDSLAGILARSPGILVETGVRHRFSG